MSNVTLPGASQPADSLRAIARGLRRHLDTDHVTVEHIREVCESLDRIATRVDYELVKAAALPLTGEETATLRGMQAQDEAEQPRTSATVTPFPRPAAISRKPIPRTFDQGDPDNAS